MNKHLIFCSASFHIQHCNNSSRENEYLFCLKQLLRFIPDNFEIVVCDNTISQINDIQNIEFKNLLINKTQLLILNRNIGKSNIGIGELDELCFVSENINFDNYDKIIYFTLRKILTNPWLFEKVNSMKKDAIISNSPFLFLYNNYNFKYTPPTPNLYNDMFFALTSKLMKEYVIFSKNNINYCLQNKIGSEQLLFQFINKHNIEYEKLDCLGLIRIDYKLNNCLQLI